METQGVVLSRVVADVERSLRFYRDGLGIADAAITQGILCLPLPGLTLFLADAQTFAHNTGLDPGASGTALDGGRGDGVISAAIATQAEVDRLLASALAAGSAGTSARIVEHVSGHRQYLGSVTDPDGYLWQLACNITEAHKP